MARCGCSGANSTGCNCAVKAGPNVTVTGAGTPGNPYIVSASGVSAIGGSTDAIDTQVVAGSPDVIKATLVLDPNAANLLNILPTGLSLTCADIAACSIFVAGDGIAIAGNTISACISNDPDNILEFVDGCLFVSSASSSGVTVASLDTDTFDSVVTNEPFGPNFIVSGNVRIDPAIGNLLTSSPAGLLVSNPVITLSAQARLLNATEIWTPGTDVLGTLTSVGFSVLSGTADLIDFNGTASVGLPVSASAQWSAEDANILIGPQSITANSPGQVLVTWTESP